MNDHIFSSLAQTQSTNVLLPFSEGGSAMLYLSSSSNVLLDTLSLCDLLYKFFKKRDDYVQIKHILLTVNNIQINLKMYRMNYNVNRSLSHILKTKKGLH